LSGKNAPAEAPPQRMAQNPESVPSSMISKTKSVMRRFSFRDHRKPRDLAGHPPGPISPSGRMGRWWRDLPAAITSCARFERVSATNLGRA
jgi:hypothetical protein